MANAFADNSYPKCCTPLCISAAACLWVILEFQVLSPRDCFADATEDDAKPANTITSLQEKRLSDDWRKKVPLSVLYPGAPVLPNKRPEPVPDENGDHATVWVENGWLMAERRTSSGDLEWQVVLAKVENDSPPQIESNAEFGIFRLSFRDGRYFIRDEKSNAFRCVRQRKTDKSWPHLVMPPADAGVDDVRPGRPPPNPVNDPSGPAIPAFDELPWILERTVDCWQYVATGPIPDATDCIVRLSHSKIDAENKAFRNVITSPFGRLVQARHGDWYELLDDGELLVARRLEEREARQELDRLARKAKLIGGVPRELGGGDWLNSDRPLSWDNWQGRVVLLDIERGGDLEGSWLILNSLARKYADRGLVIVGIADDIESDEQRARFARALEKHRVTWPFKVEKSHAATTDYEFPFYSHPHYVLVGRNGKVAWIGEKRAPREDEIEKLLEAP